MKRHAHVLSGLAPVLMLLSTEARGQCPAAPVPDPRALQLMQHHTVSSTPVDLAISPNGWVGFVRGEGPSGDDITAYNLLTGFQIFNMQSAGALNWVTDAIQTTNSRAISIASTDAGATSVRVDVLQIQYTPCPAVSLLASHTLTGKIVADVAVTPDGSKAVVVGEGRIRVFDLSSGALLLDAAVFGASIPSPLYNYSAGAVDGTVDEFADGVELSNERAIVQLTDVKTGCAPANPPLPVVFVVDLTATPPTVTAPFSSQSASGCFMRWPHDLAMSPDGVHAVTGATGTAGNGGALSLFRLDGGAPVRVDHQTSTPFGAGGLFLADTPIVGRIRTTVDSVVMTNAHLVTIKDREELAVYDITGDTLTLTANRSLASEGVHDVAVSDNAVRAIAKTDSGTHVIPDLADANSTYGAFGNPSGESPRGILGTAFTSDSVAIKGDRAVTIATAGGASTGYVEFIQFGVHPSIPNIENAWQLEKKAVALTSTSDRLVDVAFAPSGDFVFVRARASGASMDLLAYQFVSGTGATTQPSIGSASLVGDCIGVDHLEVTDRAVITISSQPGQTGGYVDVFKY